jgi:parallel beta-helix repeat protein
MVKIFIVFQTTTLSSNIAQIRSNLRKEIDDLRMRVEKCEIQGNKNSEEIKLLEKKCTTELSRFYIKEEEKIPYVFTAPPRNRYFAGRIKEIQELKRILKVEETLNEKKIRVTAVCGLGGIGKTSLVSEYAHQMKDFYKGGVYWFSAEDDKVLDKTVNDIASKLKAIPGTFDLTLSNTLRKIGTTNDPNLIVLDCLDQQDLSSNMMKFLSFPSQENFFGHFVVLTRRNPIRLFNEVSVFEDDCSLQLECFQSADAKQFLFSRSKVVRDENVESDAECLCDELGRLPLALEQAGAYIQIRRCNFSTYLKQYKVERLRLLKRQRARAAGNDSSERLAVHTTWLINMEYIKKSPDGQAAVRFMNACSFFNGNEIEEELINVGTPEVEDVQYRKCVVLPLGCREVLNLLTDFSLFTYVGAHSVSTHRLVQELVWETFTPESKAESFIDAVRMLSYAFSKCFSPSNLVNSDENNGEDQNIAISDLPKSPSHFYMWSKFCMHGHHLRRKMDDLFETLDLVWFPETAKILYECAVHLSANHQQEEAKRILNFAFRILDWLPLAGYETVERNVSNNSLFPLSIPLPKSIQIVIKRCCMPPFVSLPALTKKPGGLDLDKLEESIEKLRLDGRENFEEGRYKEALHAYSSAINLAQECNNAFNPLLLTDRAEVYIKLKQYEDALKDANDYITRRPDCWKGYAGKALALDGLNEKVSAEIVAALAFYHNRAIFSVFLPFKESFFHLQKRIFVCDTVDQLQKVIFSQEVETGVLKILVLGSEEYILNSETVDKPWNHCILVGTKKNCSVSLKSDYVISLLKCMLTNLSFRLINSQLLCIPGSFVKILNCNFTSYYGEMPAVTTMGKLSAEQCNFTGSNDAGLECVGPSNAVVVDCSFYGNGKDGVIVSQDATLIVKSSRMYNNGRDGLHILGSITSKCVVINCDINHNCDAGIRMIFSKDVTLIRNSIFGNEVGIVMLNSEACIRENNVFDNDLWGIWSMNNSWCNISMNRVFRNKAGGVRVGYRAAGKQFPRSVVELNNIYDNIGPGFVENVNSFEILLWALANNENMMKSYLKSSSSLKSAKFQDNEEHNNKENENDDKLNLSVSYCSNCRLSTKTPKICQKCFTTAYCGKICKRNHQSKHETICKVLREKSSYLITSMERVEYDITDIVEGREEIGPNDSVRAPRKGRRFDVKVHTVITLHGFSLILCDRSRQLHGRFDSKVINELVKEFGVLCERKGFEKKLFFHCLLEDNGQLRLFTNAFPKFQSW